jgi:hypothetical protein
MKNKESVKLTLRASDPFDQEIIQALAKEKNKAAFIRKAAFCYIRGLASQSGSVHQTQPKAKEKDHELNNKLSKLADL